MNNGMNLFLRIWIGEFVSNIGTGMTTFGILIYVYKLTGTTMSVSLVVLAAYAPAIVMAPFSGVIADRYDRRLLMMVGDGCSILGLAIILYFYNIDRLTLPIILIGIFINSVFFSLLEPAYKATVSDLLSSEDYSKASGLLQLANAGKFILSPLLAGVVLSNFGLDVILVLDIMTVILTLATIYKVRNRLINTKGSHSFTTNKNMHQFMSLLHREKGIIVLVYIMSFVTFCTGIIQTLYTPMLLNLTTEKMVGIMQSISGFGLLMSSLLLSFYSMKKKLIKMLVVGLMGFGGCITLIGLSSNLFVLSAGGFFMFASLPLINIGAEVLIRKNIMRSDQGKMWGALADQLVKVLGRAPGGEIR